MEQNLSQYYIFYTAAQCGSISRASRELYISQPAVSKAIQKLEQSLNTVLFRREARGVSLTEEGRLLYRHVREAFHSLDEAEQTLARRKKLGISHLRLGASATLSRYVLLRFLQRFIRAYPHVKITIACQSTYRTLEQKKKKWARTQANWSSRLQPWPADPAAAGRTVPWPAVRMFPRFPRHSMPPREF